MKYLDRASGKEIEEKVYGEFFIKLLYSNHLFSRLIAKLFLPLISLYSFPSRVYGVLQKAPWSRSKVKRFIKNFQIDVSEFQDPVSSFKSFNDFFIRKLKPSVRPIAPGEKVAILPADARYLVFPNIHHCDGFFVKGRKFSLPMLLQDEKLAQEYSEGTMVIARLAPVDYHRFHFPCDGVAHTPLHIPGPLFSVNPMALKKHSEILSQNKRVITRMTTTYFDTVLYIDIGATYVGSIHQTFTPETFQKKGAEKGYFSFGGSCLILLFKPHIIRLDQDLVAASSRSIEVLGKMGQSLGISTQYFLRN